MVICRIAFKALFFVVLKSTLHVGSSDSAIPPAPPPPPPPPPPPDPNSSFPTLPPLPTNEPTTVTPTTKPELTLDRWLDSAVLASNLQAILNYGDSISQFACGHARCGKHERRLKTLYNSPKCFCDKDCVSLGDCCYDFKKSCGDRSMPPSDEIQEPSTCNHSIPPTFYGVTVINTCLSRNPPSQYVTQCTNPNKTDIMTSQPVLDLASNKTYRNVFCGSCNSKMNVTRWTAVAHCKKSYSEQDQSYNTQLIQFILGDACNLEFYPPKHLKLNHRLCIPRFISRNHTTINDSVAREKSKELCESYAFPMCYIFPDGKYRWVKNPHCLIYEGYTDFTHLRTSCPSNNPLPPLTIFFDFKGADSYTVTTRFQNGSEADRSIKVACPDGEGYDVFSGKCRVFYSHEILHQGNKTDNKTSCKYIKLAPNEYEAFDNGSLLYASKIIPTDNYHKVNNNIYICVNLTKNYNTLASKTSREPSQFDTVLTGITIFGFALSILGLILLVISYIILPDLRNLPGKIILSLATTMLVYLVLYFFINRSDVHGFCQVVSVGLHYCILSMFCWMNVMAFDVHYTFAKPGQSSDRSSSSAYLKYAIYAWLVPLLTVTISFALDTSNVVTVGYASGPYCFMNNVIAKVCILAVPVGVILLYNTFALCHTLVNIRRVQTQAVKVTNQKQRVDLPIVCIKMTSVMGITWFLGYLASFEALAFIGYLHVILNSLQGFLIFISYVLNRRVYKMYRSYFDLLRGRHRSTSILSKPRSTNVSPASTK